MGSLKKRLRQLDDGHGTLADLPALVERAQTKKNLPPIPQNISRQLISGWEVLLSCFDHPRSEAKPLPVVEHWHCSCRLWPHGRGSDVGDWEMLGRITTAASLAAGLLEDAQVRVLNDLASSDPNGVFHFIWHTDASACVAYTPLDANRN
jgi:hypothetical protein